MVAAPGMLLNAGKKLEGACAARAIPARFTCHCYLPINLARARRKGLQLLSSFLYYFSLSSLDRRPSMGAEVVRFERFVFLFLALFCGVLLLFFGTVIFWSFRNLLTQLPYV